MSTHSRHYQGKHPLTGNWTSRSNWTVDINQKTQLTNHQNSDARITQRKAKGKRKLERKRWIDAAGTESTTSERTTREFKRNWQACAPSLYSLPSVWRGSGLGRWGRTRTESKGRWGTEDGERQETENGGRRKTERDEQEDGLWRRQDGWRQLNELRHPPSFRPSSNLTIRHLPPLTTSLYSFCTPNNIKTTLVVHPVVHPGRQTFIHNLRTEYRWTELASTNLQILCVSRLVMDYNMNQI